MQQTLGNCSASKSAAISFAVRITIMSNSRAKLEMERHSNCGSTRLVENDLRGGTGKNSWCSHSHCVTERLG
ncbi:hypothetical protein BDZ91DRAFT_719038 [Kalaharituber pfeilii]|nr:hypothetical protein BDZ91DRAFT_719038 [Kalaharituber pfeilii]